MKTVGIVAEYNPFHAGHRKQFDRVKAEFGGETAIVCAMSGNYVQRGAPAVMDKTLRAKAAVACGADLVVELPTTVSLSSAEGFAAGGVGILSKLCDTLCFGAETGEAELLMETARALLSEDFSPLLRRELDCAAPTTFWPWNTARPFSPSAPPWFPFPSGGRGAITTGRPTGKIPPPRRYDVSCWRAGRGVPSSRNLHGRFLKTRPCIALPPENGRYSPGCAP